MKKLSLLSVLAVLSLFIHQGPLNDEAEFIGVIIPSEYLFEVRDYSMLNERAATLTNYDPVIDIFEKETHNSFGRKGRGPGEFQSPSNIELSQNRKIGVMDFPAPGNIKFALFDENGSLEREEMLREIGTISSFSFVNGEEIVALTGEFASNDYSLIHYDGNSYHTIYEYEREALVITPDIGPVPRITIGKPFSNKFIWSPYSDNQIALWKGDEKIDIVNLDGEIQKTFPFNLSKYELSEKLVTNWIDRSFPEEYSAFGHDNFNIGIRKVLREKIAYPEYLPVILDLEKDPAGNGIWIQRTLPDKGEKWSLLTNKGTIKTVQFPPGRSVIAFSENYAYAEYTDEDGFDIIEKYQP